MTRRLLFHRDFHGYTGGHGKVHDYFQHAASHSGWSAAVYMTPESTWQDNPWAGDCDRLSEMFRPADADALFLGGFDWTGLPEDIAATPVINLIQHVRHADPAHPLSRFLHRRAVRVCVSTQVADAILATGRVHGPVRVIEAALNLPPRPAENTPRNGIFIDAIKQPVLGQEIAASLAPREDVVLLTQRIPRDAYLDALSKCRLAILLPHREEGFYLPALEAMSLGCATIVPDCVGNRAYLAPGVNALVPDWQPDSYVAAVRRIEQEPALEHSLGEAGARDAARFSLANERKQFHSVLDELDALWEQA